MEEEEEEQGDEEDIGGVNGKKQEACYRLKLYQMKKMKWNY